MTAHRQPIDPELASIDALQDAGVAATVAYARKHSPFYRRTLADCQPIQKAADLHLLPLTTKRNISQHNEEFWCVGRDQIVDLCTTSGTTGLPTLYPLTQSDLDRLGQNESLCFTNAGLTADDVVALAVTIDKCFMAGLAYFQGLRQIGAMAVRVGAGSPAMLLSMIERIGATAIVSVPSFLKRVADYAQQQGIDPAKSTVRKLICIGEPIRDADFLLTPLGNQIFRAWNAKVFSTYGVTELASSLCECPAGCGGHLNPQLLHIEIVDDAGQSVPDGQIGNLVATTIGVEGMPMVRFMTGDVTFMLRDRCACGSWSPRIGPILGRRDQAMKIKGTTVYPAAVERALQAIEQIGEYILIATAETPLSDALEVVISWRGNPDGAVEATRQKLQGELKVTPSVRVASSDEIRRLGHSQELRKQRIFIDRRVQPSP